MKENVNPIAQYYSLENLKQIPIPVLANMWGACVDQGNKPLARLILEAMANQDGYQPETVLPVNSVII